MRREGMKTELFRKQLFSHGVVALNWIDSNVNRLAATEHGRNKCSLLESVNINCSSTLRHFLTALA